MTDSYGQKNINLAPDLPTIHFNVGNVGAPSLAPIPGTPNAAAMSVFGQLNIYENIRIFVCHYHQIDDGTGGTSTVEIYRRRSSTFTQLVTLSLPFGGGDFGTAFAIPAGDLAVLQAGDYLFCQATAFQANGNGLTVDIHFTRGSQAN